MIFIVAAPAGAAGPGEPGLNDPRDPQAWFAFDDQDLLHKVSSAVDASPWEIWDCTSARELLDLVDEAPDRPGVHERFPAMWALGEREGWDTPLYRADALLGAGIFRREPVRPLDACIAALRARGGELRVYADEPAALAAADAPDPWFDRPGGWRARWALREQLIATEALADGY